MHQKLKFGNPFWIQFTIQEMAFRLCTKQKVRAGKVEKINNQNLHHNWINLPSGN